MNSKQFYLTATVAVLTFLLCLCISRENEPSIVVNMPVDGKPLSQLESTGTVIEPDKAVLWWTVYKATLDKGWGTTSAARSADQAIYSVYGK